MDLAANGKIKEAYIEAVIIRADGTTEDLGVVAHSDWNGLKGLIHLKDRLSANKRIKRANKRMVS